MMRLRGLLGAGLIYLCRTGAIQRPSVSLDIRVEGARANTITLNVPENISLVAAASEFCHINQLSNPEVCTYVLADALYAKGGLAIEEDVPPTRAQIEPRRRLEGALAGQRAWRVREHVCGRGALVFVHLKKCGGMTIQREVLEPAFGPLRHVEEEARWFFQHDQAVLSGWQRSFSSERVVADHVPYGFHILLSPTPVTYLTLLRQPKARLYSYYRYLQVATDWESECTHNDNSTTEGAKEEKEEEEARSQCANNWWPLDLPRNASLKHWLSRQFEEQHYQRTHVDNYMARMLCGPLGMSQPGPADHDTYLCALHNLLSQFEVVGVSERMDESVCVLRSALHLPSSPPQNSTPPPSAPLPSPSPPHPSLSRVNSNGPREKEEEEEGEGDVPDWLVRWDRLLYEAAVERLEAALEAYPHCRGQG